jgi:hypothetical protein
MSTGRTSPGIVQPQGVSEDPLTSHVRLFTRFLQVYFSNFEKGSYKWLTDPLTTDIIIQAENSVAAEVVEKRPAIVVGRGPVGFTNIAIDQFAGPLLGPNGEFTPNLDIDGYRRHTDLLSSYAIFSCLSREGIEAQRIAWASAQAVRTLKRVLMKAGIHRVGEDIQVSAESPPGSIVQGDPSEILLVSVTIPFFFQQTWVIGPNDKTLLTHIGVALRSELGATEAAPSFNGPSLYGQSLEGASSVPIDQILTRTGSGS